MSPKTQKTQSSRSNQKISEISKILKDGIYRLESKKKAITNNDQIPLDNNDVSSVHGCGLRQY